MGRMVAVATGFVLTGSLFASCGSPRTATTATSVTTFANRVVLRDAGVSFVLPTGYEAPTLAARVSFVQYNIAYASVHDPTEGTGHEFVLTAYSPNLLPPEFRSMNLGAALSALEAPYRSLGDRVLVAETRKFDGRDGIELKLLDPGAELRQEIAVFESDGRLLTIVGV